MQPSPTVAGHSQHSGAHQPNHPFTPHRGKMGQGGQNRERQDEGSQECPASAAEATSPSARGPGQATDRPARCFQVACKRGPTCLARAIPAGCCKAWVLVGFPQPRPTLQLPQLHPAWAVASKSRWLSNQSPLSRGGFSPAWHPLPLALADWCPRHSCPPAAWAPVSHGFTASASATAPAPSRRRLPGFAGFLAASCRHLSISESERERGEKVLCCVDYCVFVIWNGISCRYSISQR